MLVGGEPGATLTRRLRRRRRIVRVAIGLAAASFAVFLLGTVFFLRLPGVGDAEARVRAILAEHHGTPAALPPPRRLAEAIVSTEDENFYSAVFLNVAAGAARAVKGALLPGEDPGGSTIDQQLAKTLYPHASGILGKLEEVGIGIKLAFAYPPEQVLGMYLDSIYYGNGYWGDVAAAHGYFGVSPRRLTWAEAAMLAGLPQAPSAYDPLVHLPLARARQRHVLDQLVVNGHLTAAQADRAFREALPLRHRNQNADGSGVGNSPLRGRLPNRGGRSAPGEGVSSGL